MDAELDFNQKADCDYCGEQDVWLNFNNACCKCHELIRDGRSMIRDGRSSQDWAVKLKPIAELKKDIRKKVLIWWLAPSWESTNEHACAVMMSFEQLCHRRCWQRDFIEPAGWSEMPDVEVLK